MDRCGIARCIKVSGAIVALGFSADGKGCSPRRPVGVVPKRDRPIHYREASHKPARARWAADKRTLLRRAYFDLIGLPPTPEELSADNSPGAYSEVIEKLLAALANPRHGAIENEVRILTYAYSKDSHRREPMDWVRNWDRGRIYVTMLGHTWRDQKNPNCKCVGFQTLLARGIEWATSGKVTIPMPARFPARDTPELTIVVEV